MWWKPSTNFVARRSTFSRIVIYFFECGVHITCPYSRCSLTKVVKHFLNRGPSRYEIVLQINSAIAFAFFTFTEMCSLNFSSASRITPRSFCSKTCSSSCRWRVCFSVGYCYKIFLTLGHDNFLGEKCVAISETIAPMNLFLIVAQVRLLWLLLVVKF